MDIANMTINELEPEQLEEAIKAIDWDKTDPNFLEVEDYIANADAQRDSNGLLPGMEGYDLCGKARELLGRGIGHYYMGFRFALQDDEIDIVYTDTIHPDFDTPLSYFREIGYCPQIIPKKSRGRIDKRRFHVKYRMATEQEIIGGCNEHSNSKDSNSKRSAGKTQQAGP